MARNQSLWNIFNGFSLAATLYGIWICFSYWMHIFRISWSISLPKSYSPKFTVAKNCLILCFQPGTSQLLYQVIKAHTIGTIIKNSMKCPYLLKNYRLQYSGNSERSKDILKLAKFSESLSPFGQKYPASSYGHMVYSRKGAPVTLRPGDGEDLCIEGLPLWD